MMGGVVFSGGWDERNAELRARTDELARLLALARTRVLPVWRGRPSMADGGRAGLGWVASDHPVLAHARPERLFLGLHGDVAHFAADLSKWEPEGLDRAALAMFFDPAEYHHPALPSNHRFSDLRGAMLRLSANDAAFAATARALFNWHRSHRFCSSCGAPSDWAMAGWQRKCPACGAPHFPRTDPVVIMLVQRGNRVLLGRSPGWPEGMYSALAGFVEPGETLEAAVRREVAEETGVRVGAVRYLASQPWPWPNSLMLGFLAEAESDAITLDHELDDARWLSREDLVDVLAGLNPDIHRPRAGSIAHFLITEWLAGRLG
ncbi:MAG: NAD(+) diphosphatase [Pararhodobacter sp.]